MVVEKVGATVEMTVDPTAVEWVGSSAGLKVARLVAQKVVWKAAQKAELMVDSSADVSAVLLA